MQQLGGLDSVMLATESAANPMHMMAIMVLDPTTVPGGYSFDKLYEFVERRLHLVPPLTRRLVEVPFGLDRPSWIEASRIDLDLHLRRAAVPGPGGPREVASMAAELARHPLDRARPLWEMVVVEGLVNESVALIAKVHHALMDGVAGMQFFTAFVNAEPDLGEIEPPLRALSEPEPSEVELLVGALPSLVSRPLRFAQLGAKVLSSAVDALLEPHPPSPPSTPVRRMALNGPASPERSAAYTALGLADVKKVSRTFGTTVNDVVLAIVSGALRRHLESRGELPDLPVVAGVPFSTHEAGGDEVANAYSVIFPSLATDVADPVERLARICASTRVEKNRESPIWGDAVATLADLPAPFVTSTLTRVAIDLDLFQRMTPFCNLVVSNVPGPPSNLYFGGARIQDIYPLGPVFEGITLNVTAISVGASLDIGLFGCYRQLPDLWEIAAALSDSLSELLAAARQRDREAREPGGPGARPSC